MTPRLLRTLGRATAMAVGLGVLLTAVSPAIAQGTRMSRSELIEALRRLAEERERMDPDGNTGRAKNQNPNRASDPGQGQGQGQGQGEEGARDRPRDLAAPVGPQFEASLDEGGFLVLTEIATGRKIIDPNLKPFWAADRDVRGVAVPPKITFIPVENGADIVYEFYNTRGAPAPLGKLNIGGIRFGRVVNEYNFTLTGTPTARSHYGRNWFGSGWLWPGTIYSPVSVIQEGEYTVGVSVQYDLREYNHAVQLQLQSPGGAFTRGGRNWSIQMDLNPRRSFNEDAHLAPGERRVYRVSVRAMKGRTDEWVRVLAPYRDFFLDTYGGVQYERDPRPVKAYALAGDNRINNSNPRGWSSGSRRIDEHGWGPWVEEFERARAAEGFQRFHLRMPSGLFDRNRGNNFPFLFTSGWDEFPEARQSEGLLRSFADSGVELGLWWGRAAQVMREWNTADFEILDPDNPEHVARGFREMDGAARVGATAIGLDAIVNMPQWDAYHWISAMQRRYPGVKFVTEAICCDVLHTIAPTYVIAVRNDPSIGVEATSPHILADFVNPGHETWAHIASGWIQVRYGINRQQPLSPSILRRYVREANENGFVAVVLGTLPDADENLAQDSWNDTVPADLRTAGVYD